MRKFEVVQAYKDKDIKIPTRATKYSAGYDLAAAEDITLPAFNIEYKEDFFRNRDYSLDDCFAYNKNYGLKVLVPTGLKVYCEEDEYVAFVMRSSVATKGRIIMPNSPATIDADYADNPDNEGHCFIPLINLNPFPVHIKKGEKIAQAIFCRYSKVDNDYSDKERVGGVGSTGK